MYKYYNANPLGRRVNDCTVRAISLAKNQSWDKTYKELSEYARYQGFIFDEVKYIDRYLDENFENVRDLRKGCITVGDFVRQHPYGVYLVTMNGHITCIIDGCIYDTFNPKDRLIWEAYKVI